MKTRKVIKAKRIISNFNIYIKENLKLFPIVFR